MIEHVIAYHCGPALAGIKPANIVSCGKKKFPDSIKQIERLNHELNSKDIYLEQLYECEKRVLLLVYRKQTLQKHLRKKEITAFLHEFGYPDEVSVRLYIPYLKTRLKQNEFPHEIGAFLGYPLHDIYGFIQNNGERCLFTGEWKVYRQEETARAVFYRYHICRTAILKRILAGKTLAQLFRSA